MGCVHAWPRDGFHTERRKQPRLCVSFPVTVRGVDARGEAFEVSAVLDNVSAGGLYVRLGRLLEPGVKLFAVVRLALMPGVAAPCVAVRGIVLRAESQPDGSCGVGVRFTRHRFL